LLHREGKMTRRISSNSNELTHPGAPTARTC
jgi:hypothetical protein